MLTHRAQVQLILWDGKAATKRDIKQVFGDAAAFIDGPDGVGGVVKWCTIVVPQEGDKPANLTRMVVDHVEDDGTRVLKEEEYDPHPTWQPSSPRVFHVKPGEYILLGDDPGVLAESSVRERWPNIKL